MNNISKYLAIVCLLFIPKAYSSSSASELAILTYNVLKHDTSAPGLLDHWFSKQMPNTERIHKTIEFLKTQSVDIYALQEVTPSLLKALKKEAWIKTYHLVHSFDKNQLNKTHWLMEPYEQVILSRFPILKTEIIRSTQTKLNRKALLVNLQLKNTTLAVANVHLDSIETDRFIRAQQLQQLSRYLQHHQHAIIVGDFNFGDQQSFETKFLPEHFQDIWLTLKPDAPGYTFFEGKKGQRLDRILFKSNHLQPLAIELDGGHLSNHTQQELLSDHLSVQARFKIIPEVQGFK
jgi:endonuclease/exonuclease/phosphatase family metal-dependent hydrolase